MVCNRRVSCYRAFDVDYGVLHFNDYRPVEVLHRLLQQAMQPISFKGWLFRWKQLLCLLLSFALAYPVLHVRRQFFGIAIAATTMLALPEWLLPWMPMALSQTMQAELQKCRTFQGSA